MSLQIVNGSNQPQQYQGVRQTNFNGANPLLRNKQAIDEYELEKNLDTKEGQLAFLRYHYEKAKGSQGWISRGFNKLKNWTGKGLSTSKLDSEIEAFMNGQVPFEKVCEDINKFKYNQKEATEVFVDSLTIGTSFGVQRFGNKFGTLLSAQSQIKGNMTKSLATVAIITASYISKPLIKFIDSFGMKKSERKENRTFKKDLLTGVANAAGGVFLANQAGKGYGKFALSALGVTALNSGVRYLTIPKEDKSFEDFMSQQIENPVLKIVSLATLGAFGFAQCKKATKMENAAKNITHSYKLTGVGIEQADSQIKRISDNIQLFKRDDIKDILTKTPKGSTPEQAIENKMIALEKYNIFIPKFLQTLSDDEPTLINQLMDIFDLDADKIKEHNLVEIVQRFKSECTGARTQEDAQKLIDDIFGENKYTIIPKEDYMDKDNVKPLGVGSVAETWKVQDSSGKQYAIKLIKDGITKDKIAEDRKQLLEIIQASGTEDKEFCEKSLDELYSVWEQELDLEAEMKNGELLGQNMKKGKVAKGIEVKSKGDAKAYVMELAKGVQLSEYLEFSEIRQEMGCSQYGTYELDLLATPFIAQMEYMQIVFEQLLSVPLKGEKVMHADPHPGNIFIDYEKGSNKPTFTFIDTGNVIKTSNKEALHNTIMHLNYFLGNTDAIAKTHLEHANLNGKNKEECIKELSNHLFESFYKQNTLEGDNKMDIFSHIDSLINNWMQKNGITPDPKLANLHKAEATYFENSRALSIFKTPKEIKENGDLTISERQSNIKKYMKKFDKIEYLLYTPSKNECKKYDIILDTYISIKNEIKRLYDLVINDESYDKKDEMFKYCEEQYKIAQIKVKELIKTLDSHITNNYKGADPKSKKYTAYMHICNEMLNNIMRKEVDDLCNPRESIYSSLRSTPSIESDINEYETIHQAEIKKQRKTAKKEFVNDATNASKDSLSAVTTTMLDIVKSIIKDISCHFPSASHDLAQINKFIDEQPEKAMQGLCATLE